MVDAVSHMLYMTLPSLYISCLLGWASLMNCKYKVARGEEFIPYLNIHPN